MAQETFQGKRHYVARIGGWTVAFQSYWMPDTFGLGSDALAACQQAGAQVSLDDWDELEVDGPYLLRWMANRAAREGAEGTLEDAALDEGAADMPGERGDAPDGENESEEDALFGFVEVEPWSEGEDDGDAGDDAEPDDSPEEDADTDEDKADADEPADEDEDEPEPESDSKPNALVSRLMRNHDEPADE